MIDMLRISFFIFLFVFSLSAAVAALADTDAETLTQISQAQQGIVSVRADFEQLKVSDAFIEPLRSNGWMVFGKPGFLRWQYIYPDTNGIMLHNDQVFLIKLSPDKSEQISPADSSAGMLVNHIMEWVNFDVATLQRQYDISLINLQPVTVRLRVLDAQISQFLKSIIIEFDPANTAASQVTLLEPDGDQTVITFTNVLVNRQAADQTSAP